MNIGVWDKVAINYGYREFDRGGKVADDTAALNTSIVAIIRQDNNLNQFI